MTFLNSNSLRDRDVEGRRHHDINTNVATISGNSKNSNVGTAIRERNDDGCVSGGGIGVKTNFIWMWSFLVTLVSFTTRSFYGFLFNPKEKRELSRVTMGDNQQQKLELGNQNRSSTSTLTSTSTITTESKTIVVRSSSFNNINKSNSNSNSSEFLTKNRGAEDYFAKMTGYLPRCLQFQFHKKKLVLDLDETLISSSQRHLAEHDISVKVYIGSSYSTFFVKKRPHVDLFLDTVSQWFELVIFTASLSIYANAVIDKLDPKRHINRRYYRQSCLNKSGSYVKDLQIVCKDLSKVVIIDNSPVAFSINKENGIPIDDWVGSNPRDQSLLNLLPLLEKIRNSEDVRHVLKINQKVSNNYGGS